jgi:hypothetical protein
MAKGIEAALALIALSFVLPSATIAADTMTLGPDQFKTDNTGAGAVLCAWGIYLSVQAETAACKLPRRPVDDAMDSAILAIDEFILANSSLHPTREMLDNFKQRYAESNLSIMQRIGFDKVCNGPDLEAFRRVTPERLQASIKALLATLREPVMNPCL